MIPNIGIVVFDGAEELDFVGPWEVFTMATRESKSKRVHLLAEEVRPHLCAKGMTVVPDGKLGEAPPLDVLVVPGGRGVRTQLENEYLMGWLRERSKDAIWTTSVCTGAGLLVKSGVAAHKRVTTHWTWLEVLPTLGECEVVANVRYVRDGQVVTAAGVSAGIDMSLWVVGQVQGVDAARDTQRMIEYDPAPPYTADA